MSLLELTNEELEQRQALCPQKQKELEIVLNILNTSPLSIINKVCIVLDPSWAAENKNCKDYNNESFNKEMQRWLISHKHKVNGEEGEWSNGYLGSRWADKTFDGKSVRLAFYSKKYDPTVMDWREKKYMIMICPNA